MGPLQRAAKSQNTTWRGRRAREQGFYYRPGNVAVPPPPPGATGRDSGDRLGQCTQGSRESLLPEVWMAWATRVGNSHQETIWGHDPARDGWTKLELVSVTSPGPVTPESLAGMLQKGGTELSCQAPLGFQEIQAATPGGFTSHPLFPPGLELLIKSYLRSRGPVS